MIAKRDKNRKAVSKKDIFFSLLLWALLLSVIIFLGTTNLKTKRRREEIAKKTDAIKEEIAAMEKSNEDLKIKISQGQTKEYLERVAREQFGLKAPGEELVIIYREKGEEQEPQKEEESGLWEQLKSFFNFLK
jgi:cell division protein FtsB